MPDNHAIIKKVTKGTLLIFLGNGVHLLLVFLSYALTARYISKEDFGYLSLALGVTTVLSMICCLGYEKSLPTFKFDRSKSHALSDCSGGMPLTFDINNLLALAATLLLFVFAEQISELYKMPKLALSLKIMALSVPFVTLANLLVAYLQRYHDVQGKVIQDALSPLIRVVLIVGAILTQITLATILWAHLASFLVVTILLVVYTRRRIADFGFGWTDFDVNRQLFRFSLPFFFAGILGVIILWLDIFLLGIYSTPEEVAAYTTGNRLVRLLPIIYSAFSFIFLPIASQLFVEGKLEQIRNLYALTAKWIYACTLPLFVVYIVTPDEIMQLCFGAKYAHDNLYFQILCLGFFFFVSIGLSDISMIAFGHTWVLLGCLIVNFICNLGLDLLFIPLYGKIGAAISTTIAFSVTNILCAIYIYRRFMIHAFRKDNLKLLFFTSPFVVAVKLMQENGIVDFSIFGVTLFSIVLVSSAFLLMKTYSDEDIALLRRIQQKITKKQSLP